MSSVSVDLGTASTADVVQALSTLAAELATRTARTALGSAVGSAPESAAESGSAAGSAAGSAPGSAAGPGSGVGSGAVCMELAEQVAAVIDLAESGLAGLVGVVDRDGEMRRWGFPSTAAWLRHRCGMRPARATERATLARTLPRLPQVTKQFATGGLSYGYAATIASAVHRLGDADCGAAEDILLEMTGQGVSAKAVAVAGDRITDLIAERDGRGVPPQECARGYDRSWLTRGKSLDGGLYVKGWLNAEDGAVFDGALAHLTTPAGPDDHRDQAERTAAALTSVLSAGHQGTRMTVVIDLDTLTGGATPARLPDGTPIPAEQARRIALNAGVAPLLLGAGNLPLYLGKRVRLATPAQRRVLQTLYPTCVVEGCEVPGPVCEVDHVTGWALGDCPTDIDRLTLCCGSHNQFKHHHPDRLEITKTADGLYTYRRVAPHTQTGLAARRGTTAIGAGDDPAANSQDPRPPPLLWETA